MASIYNYTFDNSTRIGNDKCGTNEKDVQNKNFSKYQTQSYFASDCGMSKPIHFATQQPNVFYKGSHQMGIGGCNVDDNSKIKIGTIQTSTKSRISLQQRPFLTIPFLGRGPSRPVEESQLQQGGYLGNKKSCKTIMEKSLRDEQMELVPSLKASIQNPTNICEDVAAEGWIRGGLPSRELSRDKDYFTKH